MEKDAVFSNYDYEEKPPKEDIVLTNTHFFSLTETTADDVIDTNMLENDMNDRCEIQSDDNPIFMFGNRTFLGNISRSGSHDNSGWRSTNLKAEHSKTKSKHWQLCSFVFLLTTLAFLSVALGLGILSIFDGKFAKIILKINFNLMYVMTRKTTVLVKNSPTINKANNHL